MSSPSFVSPANRNAVSCFPDGDVSRNTPSARASRRMNSQSCVAPLLTVCPVPSIRLPRSGIQCSRNSRWLTLPRQQPGEPRQRRERALGGGRSGRGACRRGGGRRNGSRRRARLGDRRRRAPSTGGGTYPGRTRTGRRRGAPPRRRRAWRASRCGRSRAWEWSLLPCERQVEEQVLRLEAQRAGRRPSPSRGTPGGRRSARACRPDWRSRAGTGRAGGPCARRRRRRRCRGRSAATTPRRRGRRARPSACRRSRAAA